MGQSLCWVGFAIAAPLAGAVAQQGPGGAASSVSAPQWYSQYRQDRFVYDTFFATAEVDAMLAAQGPGGERESHGDRRAGSGDAERRPGAGIFVELGAADGLHLSNTLAFERRLGWTGLLIEPGDELFEALRRNRPNAACAHECVAGVAGAYEFVDDGFSSGLAAHRSDGGAEQAGHSRRMCRPLHEIVDDHLGRYVHVDYLSLDLEGGELDALRSWDFSRHTIDVISVEVKVELMAERRRGSEESATIGDFLEQMGYRFVERLGADEIWAPRRGLQPDPSCLLATSTLRSSAASSTGVAGGWGEVRVRLTSLWQTLSKLLGKHPSDTVPEELLDVLDRQLEDLRGTDPESLAARIWDAEGDPSVLEAECPIGMLAMSLAMLLVRNRRSIGFADGAGVCVELRHHLAFHTPSRAAAIMAQVQAYEKVVESELAGRDHELRAPLGRHWHETSFLDVIQTGWPIFGFLDLASRLVASMGYMASTMEYQGEKLTIPWDTPLLPCALQEDDKGDSYVKMKVFNWNMERRSTAAMSRDVDTCSLLGFAATRFLRARRVWLAERERSPKAREEAGARVMAWIYEGERMFREFVARHGMYAALWTAGQPAMTKGHTWSADVPPGGGLLFGSSEGETMFSVLHTLQQHLLEAT